MIYILYHGQCRDGFGAAWAAWRNLENLPTYIPVEHGQPLPDIPDGSEVFMLDFSYPRQVILDLAARCHVTILDHHKTAEKELEGLSFAVFDMHRSGAVLAWKYFFPETPVPELLLYIQDADLWQWSLSSSKEVSMAIQMYPYNFNVWTMLSENLPMLKAKGTVLLELVKQQVQEICKEVHLGFVAGHIVPVVNTSLHWSDVGAELLRRYPDSPFSASYTDTRHGERRWSLRSRPDFNVGELAKTFGGGGHPQASGFQERHRDMWWREGVE